MSTHAVPVPVPAALPAKEIPGPKGCFLFGSLPEFRKDAIGVIARAAQEHGDLFKLDLVKPAYVLNHPDHVKHVLHDRHVNYKKSFIYDRMRPMVGNGLLTSDGDFWKRQRRLAQPAFHRQRIAGFAQQMVARTGQMLERWGETAGRGGPLDVHREMMALTLAIAGDTLFSVDLAGKAPEVGQAVSVGLEITNDRFQSFFIAPKAVPTPSNRKFNAAMAVLDGMVNEIIAERRRGGSKGNDLLAMFMEARDEETGEGMSDQQLRDEVMTMALAGHETTANALSWTWYLLSRNPAVARRLQQEVHAALGGRAPTVEDVPRLGYVTQVIEESMRLFPPAWLISREAIEDDVIGGYRIPAGSNLMLCSYTTHRHPAFWENPEGFDPDRFAPERAQKRHKFAFFPFAAGPRMCIGNLFAMMEMQLVVASVVQRFQLELTPGFQAELDPNVTLRPANGIPVHLRARA